MSPHRNPLLALAATAGLLLAPSAAGQNGPGLRFEDVTSQSGISHTGLSFGVSCGDFDDDGYVDVFLNRHFSWMRASLYRNRGDGTFEDVSNSLFDDPQDARTGDRHTGTFVDFDGNGTRELLVTRGANRGQGARANKFYELSQGKLVDRAPQRGLDEPLARSRTGGFFDVDGDGDLDHVLSTETRADGLSTNLVLLQDANGNFGPTSQRRLPFVTSKGLVLGWVPSHGPLLFLDTGAPRAFDLSGPGVQELTSQLGLPTTDNQNDIALADFSGDGFTDVLTVRGQISSDYLVTGEDEVQFSLAARSGADELLIIPSRPNSTLRLRLYTFLGPSIVKIGPSRQSPSTLDFTLDNTDPNHVGSLSYARGTDVGVFVSFDPIPQAWRIAVSSDTRIRVDGILETAAPIIDVGHLNFDADRGRAKPRYFVWEEGSQFVVAREEAGLEIKLQAQSVVSGDFDNDGDVDAYVVQSTPLRNLPNLLLENLGGGRFRPLRDAAGAAASTEGRGDAVAVADLDNDGRLDLIVTNGRGELPFGSGPDQVFRNVGGHDAAGSRNHWLLVDLEGRGANRDAIGARVEAITGSRRQFRFCDGGMHTYAQNDRRLHFGLGSHARIDELVVHWPSGQVQRLQNVTVDRVLRLREP